MKTKPFKLPTISKRAMRYFEKQMKREQIAHNAWFRRFSAKMKNFKRLTRLEQFDLTSRLVGDFGGADGYTYLVYADSANHSMGGEPECKFSGKGNHSCHLHLGLVGDTRYFQFMPKRRRWSHSRCFCAQGKTRDEAIGRALKLAGML